MATLSGTTVERLSRPEHGGSVRADLADCHVVSVPAIMGVHGMMASVACIFMQAIVFRERAHMPRLGERSRPQLPCRCRRRQRSGAEASLQVGVGDRTVKEAERSGVKQLPAGALDRA